MNVFVEGNIGAGKTTIISLVEKQLKDVIGKDIQVYPEPIADWEQTPEGNLLDLFRLNPSKYGFVLQTLIMTTLLKHRQFVSVDTVNLFERSLDSAKLVFQKILESERALSPIHTYVLNQLFETMKPIAPTIHGIIYMKVSFTNEYD